MSAAFDFLRNRLGCWVSGWGVLVCGAVAPLASAELTLRLDDFAVAPISGATAFPPSTANIPYLARLNFMTDDPVNPGRAFVNDLNGPLYTLNKQTGQFTEYLHFNGRAGQPGMFDKLSYTSGLTMGLVTFEFDPDYANNGKFYTVHMEEPNLGGSLIPDNTGVPGLSVAGYTTTPRIDSPGNGNARDNVLIEWTDTNPSNNTFEGTARELMRLDIQHRVHSIGDLSFNPAASPGDPDWRVMYIASGDGASGQVTNNTATRRSPQRLDTLVGKVLRIVPDPGEHVGSSSLSANGRYRVPDDNPFAGVAGARGEVFALGFRNPHRMSWDVDPADPTQSQLIVSDIGFDTWEEVNLVQAGGNYGWVEREGNQRLLSNNTIASLPSNDEITFWLDGNTSAGTVTPTYPVLQYGHNASGGDAISSGFVYRGSLIPGLQGKYVFGDISTGKLWYADYDEMLAADDGDPGTLAALHSIGRWSGTTPTRPAGRCFTATCSASSRRATTRAAGKTPTCPVAARSPARAGPTSACKSTPTASFIC